MSADRAQSHVTSSGGFTMAESVEPHRTTILVIDDDQTTRETFDMMLTSEGYDVHVEATVEAGLAHAAAHTLDAILLDLHLPVTGGLECLRHLRRPPVASAVPVAILTADYFLDEEVARELQSLGAKVHFKPVWDSDLHRIVQELVRHGGPAFTPSEARQPRKAS
jgi:CheY-like chemotaxis protein